MQIKCGNNNVKKNKSQTETYKTGGEETQISKKKLEVGSGVLQRIKHPLLTSHNRLVLFVVIVKTKTSEQQ